MSFILKVGNLKCQVINMDYNRLYTFIKVAERKSITKAASDLYLTQQAVSKQLLLLEEELQLKLFIRAHKTLHLTRDGEILLEKMRSLFQLVDESVLTLQGKIGDLGGVIKIGITLNCVELKYILELIKQFKNKFPEIRFELVFDIDYAIEDKLLTNELDVGILATYRDQQMLKSEPLGTIKFALYCTEEFQNNHGPFKKYHDLMRVPFAEYTTNFGGFGPWMKLNCPNEAKPFMGQQAEMISESVETNESFITSDLCMGFLPKKIFNRNKNDKNLVELFPKAKPLQVNISLVSKKKETERLIEKEFKKHLKSTWESKT